MRRSSCYVGTAAYRHYRYRLIDFSSDRGTPIKTGRLKKDRHEFLPHAVSRKMEWPNSMAAASFLALEYQHH